VVIHTCNPSTQKLKQENHKFEASLSYRAEFKNSLGYIVSSRLPGIDSKTLSQNETKQPPPTNQPAKQTKEPAY
jgi:hypothetical protein